MLLEAPGEINIQIHLQQAIQDSATTVEDRHAVKSDTDLLNELLGGVPGEVLRVTPERMVSPKLPWTLEYPLGAVERSPI